MTMRRLAAGSVVAAWLLGACADGDALFSGGSGGMPNGGADGGEPASTGGVGGAATSAGGAGLAGEPASDGGSTAGSAPAPGGEGGAAGAPTLASCPAGALGFCDDGNSCTQDRCDPELGCIHEALADGAACDDGSVCTEQDSCVAGTCQGRSRSSLPALRGSVRSFGAFLEGGPEYQGLAAVLSSSRLIFAEPLALGFALRLVSAEDELQLLDETLTTVPLETRQAGNIGDSTLGTHLVPLTESRFALVSTGWSIEIYDVVDDELKLSSQARLSHTNLIAGAAGFGEHLYLCGSGLETFDVPLASAPVRVSSLEVPWPCNGLSLTPDHQRLYAATTRDIRQLSLTDPASPGLDDEIIEPAHYYTSVATDGSSIAALEDVFLQVTGDATLWDASNLRERRRFAYTDGVSIPLSIGFVGGGLQVVTQRTSGDRRTLVAELHSQNGSNADPIAELTLRAYSEPAADHVQGFATIGRPGASLSVVPPTRQVLRVGAGKLEELHGVAQGNLSRVVAAGPSRVAVYGSSSTHLLDVSEPDVPRIVAGGLVSAGSTGPLWVTLGSDSAPPQPLSVEESRNAIPNRTDFAVTQLEQTGEAAPRPVGSFALHGTGAQHLFASGLLFSFSKADAGTELTTFELPRSAGSGAQLRPIETQVLSLAPALARTYAVDASKSALIVASSPDADRTHVQVSWLQRSDGQWHPRGELTLPTAFDRPNSADFLAVRGSTVALVSERNRRVDVLELTKDGLAIRATRDFEAEYTGPPYESWDIWGIVGVDGNVVYLRSTFWDDDGSRARVLGLDLASLKTVATYDLPEAVSSMAVSDGQLVFGSTSHVVLASPYCE
ncbi:MAG: hypothetical protein EOO73_31835 [Myxococcales bacterium]|nr:MAG: hypothetical protein EOO73_31835 [Myxococcales bacterium]